MKKSKSEQFLAINGYTGFKHSRETPLDLKYACYKPINTYPLCKLNEKLSIHADVWSYENRTSMELSIRAETQSSDWVSLAFYSVSVDELTSEKLVDLETKLVQSWQAINTDCYSTK